MSASQKILVVDDEPDILAVVRIMLDRWGFQSDTFTNPFDALAAFQKNPSAYGLVITDVRMPRMNGLDLAKKILAVRPGTPVLFISAFEIDQKEFGALGRGQLGDYLKKPFEPAQLCSAVKKKVA